MDDVFAKAIMWTQVVLIGVFVLDVDGLEMWVPLMYILIMPVIMVYVFIKKHIPIRDKVLIILSASFILLATLFRVEHIAGAGIFHFLAMLSIVSLLLLMVKGSNDVYNEIGFMFILAVVSGYGCISYMVGN